MIVSETRGQTRGKPFDISGMKFGSLVAVKIDGKKGRQNLWLCECDCGNYHHTTVYLLKSGGVKSCGCQKGKLRHRHCVGGAASSEYSCWRNMKQRCYNQNNGEFKNYGARGIRVCERWLNSFETFLEDMGGKPNASYSIDRIDVNGNYSHENCRWVTTKTQNDNKRQSVMVTAFGETLSLTSIARKYGINPTTLKYRLKYLPAEAALTLSKQTRGGICSR